ncbi:MAG: hypothetical protein Q8S58_20410 [Bosea sp. (in: a-proteobacteria)]|uniref:hypothetical protein n=1 Tax=Bosea sp. (in: a-proteobacteria) TaxID=1871050 RepID=UPI002732C11B|nr:hypothetical protein [Bosea sp. (in: a-proteobacteria)]MDP3257325.1 hypothetical protein [Bosea sp. (in: a-proteobacteria)]MDP3321493.1 hypothetical protein [Bosea sp. (in: a-proteobacteria)]
MYKYAPSSGGALAKLDPSAILSGSFDRIKLGTGVVGKLTTAVVALFGVLGVIAYGLQGKEGALLTLGFAAIAVFIAFCGGVALYAIQFPHLAALEGADLIKWRQMDMAASDPKIVIDNQPNVLPPLKTGRDHA